MKNRFFYLFSLVLLMATSACSDEGEKDELLNPPTDNSQTDGDNSESGSEDSSESILFPEEMEFSPTVPREGGEINVNFTATDDWIATLSASAVGDRTGEDGLKPQQAAKESEEVMDWITVSPESGVAGEARLVITLVPNDTYDQRSATVVISCGAESRDIVVTQKPVGVKAEREALVEFYRALDGDHWVNNTNWCSDKPISEWFGVTMNEEGELWELSLRNNNLSGMLPDVFDKFSSLCQIQLSENKLVGELPHSLYALDMINFYVANNQLTGSLSEDIANWKNLKGFNVYQNNFDGTVPAALGKISGLTYCDLLLNRFSGELTPEIIAMEQQSGIGDFRFYLEPQQEGYEFTASTTRTMIPLGDNLYLHPEGIALEYRQGVNKAITYEEMKPLLKKVYEQFEDRFDFVACLYNVGNMAEISGEIAGEAFPISNDIQGIDREIFNNAAQFGSSGRLKSLIQLGDRGQITGSFLHEVMHSWGALNFGQSYVDVDGHVISDPVHWGISSIDGMLGGFKLSTLERNVNENPHKYRAFCSLTDWCFAIANPSNTAYAPLELYLMGLISPDEVPDIYYYTGVSGSKSENPAKNGIFYAEEEHVITIEDLITRYGVRVPDYRTAQKDFNVLAIVITKNPVNDREWALIEDDITKMQIQGESGYVYGNKNFYEATGGRGTMTFGGLSRYRKK